MFFKESVRINELRDYNRFWVKFTFPLKVSSYEFKVKPVASLCFIPPVPFRCTGAGTEEVESWI